MKSIRLAGNLPEGFELKIERLLGARNVENGGKVKKDTQDYARRGIAHWLIWLQNRAGSTWQEKWSDAEDDVLSCGGQLFGSNTLVTTLNLGLSLLLASELFRPSYKFLLTMHPVAARDYSFLTIYKSDWDVLLSEAEALQISKSVLNGIRRCYFNIAMHKGIRLLDFDLPTLLNYERAVIEMKSSRSGIAALHTILANRRVINDIPKTSKYGYYSGSFVPEKIVESYNMSGQWYSQPIIEYLRERSLTSKGSSMEQAAYHILILFWSEILKLNPEQDSFQIDWHISHKWKQWIAKKEDGTDRKSLRTIFGNIRSLYNFLERKIEEDPSTWLRYGAYNPISTADVNRGIGTSHRAKESADARLSIVMTHLDTFRRETLKNLKHWETIVSWANSVSSYDEAEFDGIAYQVKRKPRDDYSEDEQRFNFVLRRPGEHAYLHIRSLYEKAFFLWVCSEILLRTGMRSQELYHLNIHDIDVEAHKDNNYYASLRIPAGKTEKPRIIKIDAEVLKLIDISEQRSQAALAAYPHAIYYDTPSKRYSAPQKLIMQRLTGGRRTALDDQYMSKSMTCFQENLIQKSTLPAGFHFTMREFRRLYATTEYRNGVDIEKIRIQLGHTSSNMTRGYIISEEVSRHNIDRL